MILAALALAQGSPVEDFYAELARANSATAVLQKRCEKPVRAQVDRAAFRSPSAEQRERLKVGPRDRVAYRSVRLTCGGRLLSAAQNWYVPSRLTPAARQALRGDTPFGVAIRPLAPTRANLWARREWRGRRRSEILRHASLVRAGDGTPLAEVLETYHRAALGPERCPRADRHRRHGLCPA